MDFSLFYFASDEGDYATVEGREKYKLLLEGARFADDHDFCAVWTPERHFHTFGGMFPSPAVAAGALAMITKRVGIRAGSVVLPLHSPVRVTEEWSLVDNLSDGRVGISFASGWQPQDFAIAPEAYADRHQRMFEGIETVRALWRGETRQSTAGDGKPVTFGTRPRPVQSDLPIWVTAGGTPETFRRAGEIGANILTHLLQQSIEQVRDRLAIYRNAWRAAGHPGEGGKVTLMLHTFVSHDEAYVRSVVHEPFKNYLKGAVGLFAAVAPKGVDLATLSPADLDALAEHAFDRYFESSGLFGTPDSCAPMVERLRQTGVTEIACLLDFGIEAEIVLANLPWLDELRQRWVNVGANQTAASALDWTPLTPNGKVNGKALTVPVDVTPSAEEFVAPGSPTELALAELWRTSLKVDAIGAMDNFFDSGGHSLLAMQLTNRIRDRFGVDIAVKDVFHRPTLRDLATHIDTRKSTAAARAELGRAEHAKGFEYGEV
jgi:natural product biosynthesis luciferase-like monooxygenase protein